MAARDTGAELWMVLAIIQSFKLDAVTLALQEIPGFAGLTVTECRGTGDSGVGGETDLDGLGVSVEPPAEAELLEFTPKVRVEVGITGKELAERVVDTIARAAHTGRRGDGKVFAWPVSRAVRIRTLEEGTRTL